MHHGLMNTFKWITTLLICIEQSYNDNSLRLYMLIKMNTGSKKEEEKPNHSKKPRRKKNLIIVSVKSFQLPMPEDAEYSKCI